jgi:uncharacterized protein DUF2752
MRLAREPGGIVLAAMALLLVLCAAWLRLGLPVPGCTFKAWAGLPCATCGTTRLIAALVAGRLVEALTWNPLVFCAIALTSAWGTLSAARSALGLPPLSLAPAPRHRGLSIVLLALAVIANWIYLVLLGI